MDWMLFHPPSENSAMLGHNRRWVLTVWRGLVLAVFSDVVAHQRRHSTSQGGVRIAETEI